MVDLLDYLFANKKGKRIFLQQPNWQLALTINFWLIANFTHGDAKKFWYALFLAIFGYWAVLEINSGVNRFRKILGSLVLAYVAFRAFTVF